jgi:predicted polyphosphate/ATP-dependent NAD kinase
MTELKEKISKDKAYNKKRKPILRVEATTADTPEAVEEMEQMKVDLIEHSGSAKQGVIDVYKFAKENGFFEK